MACFFFFSNPKPNAVPLSLRLPVTVPVSEWQCHTVVLGLVVPHAARLQGPQRCLRALVAVAIASWHPAFPPCKAASVRNISRGKSTP